MMKKVVKMICLSLSILVLATAVFTPTASAADTGVKRVSVSVNGDTQTSRGFNWCTTTQTASVVKIMKEADYEGSFDGAVEYTGASAFFKDNYYHKVTVSDLEAATDYVYIVGDGTTWSDAGSFRTNAGREENFSFIAIADVQASGIDNFIRASKVLNAAETMLPNSDFTVSLGDFVNDCTNQEWDDYFTAFKDSNLNSTGVPVVGNHEGNLKWNWFNNMFNLGAPEGGATQTGSYYSFDYGNAHIAVLNTNDMYPMSQEQLNWLKNDMNKTDADWKFVFMHRALYSAGKNINKPDTVIMRNVLLPVIDELGIDLVMAGHDHMYMRTYQVKGDEVQQTQTVTELFNGVETEFAVNPEGTVHILPSTAGTKRYSLNEEAISPILDLAAKAFDTKSHGTFSTVEIDMDDESNTTRLVYKAYAFNEQDENAVPELIDSYAIKKDMGRNTVDPDYEELPETNAENIMARGFRFFNEMMKYMVLLFTKILPKMIF
ncbi:MAG: metallophosphoesterase family protein [Oscillospiraceae bacterium]|jgi:phosphodiesterase/alkaline phosphatase D-like protein|nr:metallophosphoesterase family protein [Oscillospiraceae bacterium]